MDERAKDKKEMEKMIDKIETLLKKNGIDVDEIKAQVVGGNGWMMQLKPEEREMVEDLRTIIERMAKSNVQLPAFCAGKIIEETMMSLHIEPVAEQNFVRFLNQEFFHRRGWNLEPKMNKGEVKHTIDPMYM
jgi:hypothetical protein